ncbi:MAG TPA: S41 family peptidase, partial [Planctomycetota bacterium]|nr:S41 family peptidase [Planctomycetota bacterium]
GVLAEDKTATVGTTAHLTIASDPTDAVVSLASKDAPRDKKKPHPDRILGRTPVTVEVPAGPAEVVIAKDGYVLKVESIELQAGAAQRLEVRLTKDVVVPFGISFKDTGSLVKSADEGERLVDRVLHDVVALYVEEKDPRALIDAGVKTLVESLAAVRERETLLRRELGEAARARFYPEEVDLRSYPTLSYSETPGARGAVSWSLAAGTVAIEGAADPADYETYRAKLHAVSQFLKNRWDLSSKLDDSMLTRAVIEGIVGALDDQHTHFLSAEAFREMGEETNGKFGGIGLLVGTKEGGTITVIAPMEGTPGEKAGILPGDRIIAIDGHATEGMFLSDVTKLMRGDPGTPIELTIRRGDEAPFKVGLKRATITITSVRSSVLEGTKIGYLRISSFMAETLETDVAHALDDLDKKEIQGLVIDLRNNPGGLLQKAVQIADTLVPAKKEIVSMRARVPVMCKTFEASGGPKRKRYPIAILVNDQSASASEVLAGTLREHGLAFLVGERTFGKGSVQRVIPLEPFGCALALTIATYHLPSGATPHKKGLEPDVVVKLTDEEKVALQARNALGRVDMKDRQLQTAIAEIEKRVR